MGVGRNDGLDGLGMMGRDRGEREGRREGGGKGGRDTDGGSCPNRTSMMGREGRREKEGDGDVPMAAPVLSVHPLDVPVSFSLLSHLNDLKEEEGEGGREGGRKGGKDRER